MELPPPEALELRRKAQTEYVEHLKKSGKAGPLLVGRFVARQINAETLRLIPGVNAEKPSYIDSDGDDYGLGDHMERLKYIDVPTVPEDHSLLANVLGAAVPDLNQFITDERMAILLGKMAYNAYGVSFGGGREDKVLDYGASFLFKSGLWFFVPASISGASRGPRTHSHTLRHLSPDWICVLHAVVVFDPFMRAVSSTLIQRWDV